MVEEKTNFLFSLNYQISLKDRFYKKIPNFREQINRCNKSINILQEKFEGIRRRCAYKTLLSEFKDIIEKKKT